MKISRRLIDITGMRDIIQRRIPVLTLDSHEAGPTVWLTACIHGDEAGGTVIVHDVFKAVRQAGMRGGILHGLPLINSMGFENVSRYINADREDLNRCFPGSPRGSMGEQIAHSLFGNITRSKPDLVIDLHNDWIQSVPYILIDPTASFASAKIRRKTLKLANAAQLLQVQESSEADGLNGDLSGALVAAGIPAFTIESGGACGIVEEGVAAGKSAVLRVLHQLGMIERPTLADTPRTDIGLLNYTSRPRCTSSGLVRFAVTPGDRVKKNQVLARVFTAFGSCEETLRAARPGYVLGVADHARAVPNCEVIAIGELADAAVSDSN